MNLLAIAARFSSTHRARSRSPAKTPPNQDGNTTGSVSHSYESPFRTSTRIDFFSSGDEYQPTIAFPFAVAANGSVLDTNLSHVVR